MEAIVHFDSFGKPLLPNMNPYQTTIVLILIVWGRSFNYEWKLCSFLMFAVYFCCISPVLIWVCVRHSTLLNTSPTPEFDPCLICLHLLRFNACIKFRAKCKGFTVWIILLSKKSHWWPYFSAFEKGWRESTETNTATKT